MAIFEVGILRNGMLLTNRTYYGSEMDDSMRIRRTQILNAIAALASVLLKDSVKFIKFEKMMVGIYIFENEETPKEAIEGLPEEKQEDPEQDNMLPLSISSSINEGRIQPAYEIDEVDAEDMEISDDICPKTPLNDNISAYCIGDSQMLENQIFALLRKITKVFIRKYPSNGSSSSNVYENTNTYSLFTTDIDKILKDIQYTPIDRLKFGIL